MMKLKHYPMLLIPVCLVTFVLRALELILCIDPRSGYFTVGSVLPTVMNVFLLLVALLFATVLLTKRELKPTAVRLRRASRTELILGIAAAMATVAYALSRWLVLLFDKTVPLSDCIKSPDFLLVLLALGSAVFLIFYVTYPKVSAKQNLWRAMSLFLTGYTLLLLVRNFLDPDVAFSHAFGIYHVVFYGMAAAASVSFSKIMARLFGRKAFFFFTCMMTVFAALRLADTVLALIPENPYAVPETLFATVADLLLTGFYLWQMKKLLKPVKKRRPVEEAPAEEEPSEPAQEA